MRLWRAGSDVLVPVRTLTGHSAGVASAATNQRACMHIMRGLISIVETVCISGARDGVIKQWDLQAAAEVGEGCISRNVVCGL